MSTAAASERTALAEDRMSMGDRIRAWVGGGGLGDRAVLLLALLILLIVVMAILDAAGITSGRFNADYLASTLIGYVPLALLALAELFVITSGRGGIDLSVGSMVSLTGIAFGMLYQQAGMPLAAAIIAAVAFGALLGLVNGVLTFIFLSIMGASMPAVFALVAFAGSLIPLVGTMSASIIIVLGQLVLMPTGSSVWWIAAIYYLVYMQLEAYVISPRIMASAVSVPGPIVVIAALTGGTLLGLLGAMIAIPVAASLLIIVKRVIIPAQNER